MKNKGDRSDTLKYHGLKKSLAIKSDGPGMLLSNHDERYNGGG